MIEDDQTTIQKTEHDDSEQSKDQKIDALISELEAINYQGEETDAFDYSNDQETARLMPQIIQSSNEIPGEIRTVIMVGSGPVFNIPKELSNVDLIISVDINPNQLKKNKARIQKISSAQSTHDLHPVPNPNVGDDIIEIAQERKRLAAPNLEKGSYGRYHYMSSEEKLRETQEYFKQPTTKIAYVCGDLSDMEFTTKFGNILKSKDANIVFAGLSNVGEWICRINRMVSTKRDVHIEALIKRDAYIEALSLLPINSKCPILHSRTIGGRAGFSPIYSKLSLGLDAYGQDLMTTKDLLSKGLY